MAENENIIVNAPEMEILSNEKQSAYDYRKRRHVEWSENYTLSRNKVITNRLTQRQSVNVPLMKYALGSIMKEIDEPNNLYFKNLDNNSQKEVFYNEYWKDACLKNNMKLRDNADKRSALLYGRPFKKLNIVNGAFKVENVDPQHMLVDRFVDPLNLHSAKYLIQTDIYKPLKEILDNEDYNPKGKKVLKGYYEAMANELEQDNTLDKIQEKNQRMLDMGLDDAMDPLLGETYIELNEFYRFEHSDEEGQDIIFVYTVAVPGGSVVELQKRKLHEMVGPTVDNFWYNHFPFNTWATESDPTDFWSDGPADILRGTNQVLNTWISQLIENRTLRNYNMHYYDSTNDQFIPQTYTPEPWGWYPLPGKPSDVMETVQVADLSESLDEIEYLINLAEKAVATTSAQTGDTEGGQVTLGEVKLALANAQERVRSIAMFYTESWRDFGMLYVKMLEGASDKLDPVTIVKEGRLGKKMYSKEVTPEMWLTKSGYKVEVQILAEKQEEDINTLQKLNATVQVMPNNMALKRIYNKKILQFAGLTVEELAQVEEFETQNSFATPMPVGPGATEQPESGGQPLPQVPESVGAQVPVATNGA
jgi:hypothetical protein